MKGERFTGHIKLSFSMESWMLFPGLRRRSEESAALLVGGSRRRESEHLLNVLSYGHRAENVQKYERAVGVVFAGQITMGNVLKPADRHKRQLGDHSTIEYRIEHTKQSCKREADCKHRFHLDHRQISVVSFQFLLLSLEFLLLTSIRHLTANGFLLFLQFLALFFNF